MKNKIFLNGWYRLWILFSLLWFVFTGFIAVDSFSTDTFPRHQSIFLSRLETKHLEMLVNDESEPITAAVEMPNKYLLKFRNGVDNNEQLSVANAYQDILIEEKKKYYLSHIKEYLLVAILPSLIVLFIGIGISWVRDGFKLSN